MSEKTDKENSQLPVRPLPMRKKNWTLRLGLVAGLLMVVCSGVYLSEVRQQAPAAQGAALVGKPVAVSAEQRRMRLATFNMASGRGADGRVDLARTARFLIGYDLVALNEVDGSILEGSDDANQAAVLGKALHVPYLFAPTEKRLGRGDFGNGVLSVLNVHSWQSHPLPGTQWKGHRHLLTVTVVLADTKVNVLITHLDRTKDRAAQLQKVIDAFAKAPAPAVLMGDLNTRINDPLLGPLLAIEGVREPAAEMGQAKAGRIDYIFTRGLEVIDGGTEDEGVSDHPLVWAEVELAEPVAK